MAPFLPRRTRNKTSNPDQVPVEASDQVLDEPSAVGAIATVNA